jgi:catechol 2,3-dioxygenase-like lactoylglutathione lyase family enzyme
MPYKLSKCICLSTPGHDEAVRFYRDVIGLETVEENPGSIEFSAEPYRLFVDRSDAHGSVALGMVLELLVHDLEIARQELVDAGCEVIRWEGRGKDCYIRDPFGAIFNLWEEPEAFDK